jgi:hypothetical protein
MKAAFVAAAVLAIASVMFYFGTAVHAAKASGPASAERASAGQRSAGQVFAPHQAVPSHSVSLPLFFEPNQGQVAAPVKFLAHGAGYGLFLTADEAVLDLRRTVKGQPSSGGVVRMRLDGANSSATVSGASPLPGKSSYFIGNDPSKWRRDIPQFARVQYQSVYPGVDLVYYGNQGQLEYDFRVAPAADPNQIAFSFQGASARIVNGDSGDSGDLVLSTANGDVRFHAPHVYQPAAPQSAAGNASGSAERSVAGAFRQLAGNKIGFTIGDYDHSRELVIDPTLTYSTYLGGSNTESLVRIAVDSSLNIYLAGSTNSTDFPLFPAGNSSLTGTQNIFISKITPANASIGIPEELVYSIYLGGSGTDSLAGIAVDANNNIYVAGSTNSACTTTNTTSCFPTTSNAFQTASTVAMNGGFPGTHGFLSLIAATQSTTPPSIVYNLSYSTYLAGNGVDQVTGLAIDTSNQYAYVTGNTTSSNVASDQNPFPANPNNAYQPQSNAPPDTPGYPQFFATKINTTGSGPQSLIYSTYFGGGNPASGAIANGGGIAVDLSGNMYITGTTNMLSLKGPNGEPGFPVLDAQQACLNQVPGTSTCTVSPSTDAFVAKINPAASGMASLVYSTYVGGSSNDSGLAIAVDSTSNAYITGATSSTNWVCACDGFQGQGNGGIGDAFIAKIGNQTVGVYPLNYFTYVGGPSSGASVGNAILVDSVQAVHVTGNTSGGLTTVDAIQPGSASSYNGNVYGGDGDAFVALISTSDGGIGAGDYLTYLGGGQQDQGTGIALDIYGTTYVAGNTQSSQSSTPPFPITATAYQNELPGPQAAFVSKLGAVSTLVVSYPTTSPSPNPVAAGTQAAFTFDITNSNLNGVSDPASQVVFTANVNAPTNSLASNPTAKVTSGSGNCGTAQQGVVSCFIQTLAVGAMAIVEVDLTPIINPTPPTQEPTQVTVSGTASANGGPFVSAVSQQVNVVDFSIQAQPGAQTVQAGLPATFNITFCPTIPSRGYSGTITPSQSTLPSMVTSPAPGFLPTSVPLSGSACGYTVLTIPTVARPVVTGSRLRRGSFYATWLPIGGLSMVGLGIGAAGRRRRRRWLAGAILGLIIGIILLLPGCGSASSATASQGGTAAGTYTITIEGSAGTGASHSQPVYLTVT